jgi:hypothetical protein
VLGEQYAISAGGVPRDVGVLDGGQDASLVTKDMMDQGWIQYGTRLAMEPLNVSNNLDGETAGSISQVQPSGSDVIFGNTQADLSQAGSPRGTTLARDPVISALANCLGDVVAATFMSGFQGPALKPAEFAVGVTRPASKTTVPRAVFCAAFASSGAASQFTADLRQALSSGLSQGFNEQWSHILRQASVTSVGGTQHVVRWRAQTPGNAAEVFSLVYDDLPALPGECSMVPPRDTPNWWPCV